MSKDPFNPTVFGLSPLGNNSISTETKGYLIGGYLEEGYLEEDEVATPQGVPLVFDSITGTWCAELSKINQEDREVGLEVARLTNEDQAFLAQVGYTQS